MASNLTPERPANDWPLTRKLLDTFGPWLCLVGILALMFLPLEYRDPVALVMLLLLAGLCGCELVAIILSSERRARRGED